MKVRILSITPAEALSSNFDQWVIRGLSNQYRTAERGRWCRWVRDMITRAGPRLRLADCLNVEARLQSQPGDCYTSLGVCKQELTAVAVWHKHRASLRT